MKSVEISPIHLSLSLSLSFHLFLCMSNFWVKCQNSFVWLFISLFLSVSREDCQWTPSPTWWKVSPGCWRHCSSLILMNWISRRHQRAAHRPSWAWTPFTDRCHVSWSAAASTYTHTVSTAGYLSHQGWTHILTACWNQCCTEHIEQQDPSAPVQEGTLSRESFLPAAFRRYNSVLRSSVKFTFVPERFIQFHAA